MIEPPTSRIKAGPVDLLRELRQRVAQVDHVGRQHPEHLEFRQGWLFRRHQ